MASKQLSMPSEEQSRPASPLIGRRRYAKCVIDESVCKVYCLTRKPQPCRSMTEQMLMEQMFSPVTNDMYAGLVLLSETEMENLIQPLENKHGKTTWNKMKELYNSHGDKELKVNVDRFVQPPIFQKFEYMFDTLSKKIGPVKVLPHKETEYSPLKSILTPNMDITILSSPEGLYNFLQYPVKTATTPIFLMIDCDPAIFYDEYDGDSYISPYETEDEQFRNALYLKCNNGNSHPPIEFFSDTKAEDVEITTTSFSTNDIEELCRYIRAGSHIVAQTFHELPSDVVKAIWSRLRKTGIKAYQMQRFLNHTLYGKFFNIVQKKHAQLFSIEHTLPAEMTTLLTNVNDNHLVEKLTQIVNMTENMMGKFEALFINDTSETLRRIIVGFCLSFLIICNTDNTTIRLLASAHFVNCFPFGTLKTFANVFADLLTKASLSLFRRFIRPALGAQADEPFEENLVTSLIQLFVSFFRTKDLASIKIDTIRVNNITNLVKTLRGASCIYSYIGALFKAVHEGFLSYTSEAADPDELYASINEEIPLWLKKIAKFEVYVENNKPVNGRETVVTNEMKVELVNTKNLGDKILHTISASHHPNAAAALVYLRAKQRTMEKICESLNTTIFGAKVRNAPYVMYMHGLPGVGKSIIYRPLLKAVYELLGREFDTERDIYRRSAGSDFWDGYGNQRVHVMDDFFQEKDDAVRRLQIAAIMDVASQTPFNLNMADVGSKGATYYTSELVYISAQEVFADHVLNGHIHCVNAFKRRIDTTCEVVVKDDYLDRRNNLDKNKIGEAFNPLIYEFLVDGNRYNWKEFVCYLVFNMRKHLSKQLSVKELNECSQVSATEYDDFVTKMQENQLVMPTRTLGPRLERILEDRENKKKVEMFSFIKKVFLFDEGEEALPNLPVEYIDEELNVNDYMVDWDTPALTSDEFKLEYTDKIIRDHLACNDTLVNVRYLTEFGKKHFKEVANRQSKYVQTMKQLTTGMVSKIKTVMNHPLTKILAGLSGVVAMLMIGKGLFGKKNKFEWKPIQGFASGDNTTIRGARRVRQTGRHLHKCQSCETEYTHEGNCIETPDKFSCANKQCKFYYGNSVYDATQKNPKQAQIASGGYWDVVTAVSPNCVKLTTKTGNKMKYIRGFFLKNNILLVPSHFFIDTGTGEYDMDMKIQVEGVRDKFSFEVKDCDTVFDDLMDIAIIVVKGVSSAKDITKHFMKDEELVSIIPRGLLIQYQGAVNFKFATMSTESITLSEDASDISYKMDLDDGSEKGFLAPNGWIYNSGTEVGDCGSLLVSCSNNMSHKLLGCHTAGSSTVGLSAVITQNYIEQLLEELPKKETIVESPKVIQSKTDAPSCFDDVKDKNIEFIRNVPLTQGGGKTKLKKSSFYGKLWKPTTCPSLLYKVDDLDPWKIAIAKMFEPDVKIPEDDLNLAKLSLLSSISEHPNCYSQIGTITHHEAINGICTMEYMTPINMHTSAGYPYTTDPNCGKGKFGLFEFEESKYYPKKKLQNGIDAIEEALEQGLVPDTIFLDSLKDERRPIEKVEAGKTRLFSCCATDFSIIVKRYFGGFMGFLMHNHIYSEVSVGLNPHDKEWNMFFNDKNKIEGQWIAGDFGAFDKKMPYDVLRTTIELCNMFYNDEHSEKRLLLGEAMFKAQHLLQGQIYRVSHGMPSGAPITAVFNSLANALMFRLAYHTLSKEKFGVSKIENFNTHVKFAAYGDDHIAKVATCDTDWYNMQTISKYLATIGMEYTTATKGDIEKPFVPLSQLTYLKRNFVKRGPRYYGPLCTETIFEVMNWYRKTPNMCEKQCMQDIFISFLVEASSHSHFKYKEWNDKVHTEAAKLGFALPVYDYRSMREMLDKNIGRGKGLTPVHELFTECAEGTKPDTPPFKKHCQSGKSTVIETTAFEDCEDTHNLQPAVIDPYKQCRVPFQVPTITDFLSRYYPIIEIIWEAKHTGFIASVNVPHDLLKIGSIWNKLKNFRYFRADVEVTIKINGTQWHYGTIMASSIPHNEMIGTLNPYDKDIVSPYHNIYTAYASPHTLISPTTNVTTTIQIPYTSPKEFIDLDNLTPTDDFGNINFWVLTPLSGPDGNVAPVSITVFARFKNIDITGFCIDRPPYIRGQAPGLFNQSSYKVGNAVKGKDNYCEAYDKRKVEQKVMFIDEDDFEDVPGPWEEYNIVDDKVVFRENTESIVPQHIFIPSKEVKCTSNLKVQTKLAHEQVDKSESGLLAGVKTATEVVTTIGSTLEKLGVLDKPNDLRATAPMYMSLGHMATGQGLEGAKTLGVSPNNFLPSRKNFMCKSIGHTKIANVVGKFGLLDVVKVDAKSTATTNLWTRQVTPLDSPKRRYENKVGTAWDYHVVFPTPLHYVARCFQFWQGTIRYKFKFVCSSFHACRFRISWHPSLTHKGDVRTPDLIEDSNVINKIVDIKTQSEVIIDIPYMRSTAEMPMEPNLKNGEITISLLNNITYPQLKIPNIYIIVSICGGSDTIFSMPNTRKCSMLPFTATSEYLPKQTFTTTNVTLSDEKVEKTKETGTEIVTSTYHRIPERWLRRVKALEPEKNTQIYWNHVEKLCATNEQDYRKVYLALLVEYAEGEGLAGLYAKMGAIDPISPSQYKILEKYMVDNKFTPTDKSPWHIQSKHYWKFIQAFYWIITFGVAPPKTLASPVDPNNNHKYKNYELKGYMFNFPDLVDSGSTFATGVGDATLVDVHANAMKYTQKMVQMMTEDATENEPSNIETVPVGSNSIIPAMSCKRPEVTQSEVVDDILTLCKRPSYFAEIECKSSMNTIGIQPFGWGSKQHQMGWMKDLSFYRYFSRMFRYASGSFVYRFLPKTSTDDIMYVCNKTSPQHTTNGVQNSIAIGVGGKSDIRRRGGMGLEAFPFGRGALPCVHVPYYSAYPFVVHTEPLYMGTFSTDTSYTGILAQLHVTGKYDVTILENVGDDFEFGYQIGPPAYLIEEQEIYGLGQNADIESVPNIYATDV